MPIYEWECDICGVQDADFMSDATPIENRPEYPCKNCHGTMIPFFSMPMLCSDGISGCVNYEGFNVGLDQHVGSRAECNRVMKEKGLEPYAQSTESKRHFDEAAYIKNHAPRGDPEAKAAMRDEFGAASKKRRTRMVRCQIDKARPAIKKAVVEAVAKKEQMQNE